jgi:hypothetical protein
VNAPGDEQDVLIGKGEPRGKRRTHGPSPHNDESQGVHLLKLYAVAYQA